MYAVIKTGGKQYRVKKGDVLRVEKLDSDAGSSVEISDVLMVGGEGDAKVGSPFVDGAKVTAEVTSHGRAAKVKIIKFRRRKHHMKRAGHRQSFTELRITDISAG